jgi:hypothetical protein
VSPAIHRKKDVQDLDTCHCDLNGVERQVDQGANARQRQDTSVAASNHPGQSRGSADCKRCACKCASGARPNWDLCVETEMTPVVTKCLKSKMPGNPPARWKGKRLERPQYRHTIMKELTGVLASKCFSRLGALWRTGRWVWDKAKGCRQ